MPRPKNPLKRKIATDPVSIMLRALRLGLTTKLAANLVGLDASEFEKKCADEPEFAAKVRRSLAHQAQRQVSRLDNHGKKFWQASAWLLERVHPQDYAPAHAQLSVQTNVATGPTNVVVLGPERAKVLATRYEAIRNKTIELLGGTNGEHGQSNGRSDTGVGQE